jgi:hypothetical protein
MMEELATLAAVSETRTRAMTGLEVRGDAP